MKSTFDELKKFLFRGNIVDLAVAVVVGAAFGAVVTSLVTNIITPILAIPGGNPDFSDLYFTINGSRFNYGAFLNAVISFISIGVAIFLFVVKPMNYLNNRNKGDDEVTKKECPRCLSMIPLKATRCAFCTSDVAADA